MPQPSLKCSDLKGHSGAQTETLQAQLCGEANGARAVCPNQSLAGRWLFHFCQEFLQVSWAKLHPAKTLSSSSGWLSQIIGFIWPSQMEERQSRNTFPQPRVGFGLEAAKMCREPVNQHDSTMPPASSINDYALQVVCVFPFRSCHWGVQCLPRCGAGGTQTHRCISHKGRNFPQACCKMKSLERQGLWVIADVQLQMEITSS